MWQPPPPQRKKKEKKEITQSTLILQTRVHEDGQLRY